MLHPQCTFHLDKFDKSQWFNIHKYEQECQFTLTVMQTLSILTIVVRMEVKKSPQLDFCVSKKIL